MKELTMTIERFVEKCAIKIKNKCENKVYKIYFDNQTLFKTIQSMKSNNDQIRLRRIQKACETMRSRVVDLKFRWILEYQRIQNNKNINIIAKNVYKMSMSFKIS